jgi:lipopolysaccharide export system protein LptA
MPSSAIYSKFHALVSFNLFPASLQAFILLAAMVGTGLAFAEKADRNKPMNIEADTLKYDDIKQVSVFTGRVVLTKGTIQLRGGQLDVRQDPEGYQFGLVLAEPGKLAFFRQKRDGVDEYIEGEGEIIEYDGKADTVKFVKRAQLRRYKGAVLNDEISGGVIVYDNTVDVFTVDGGVTRGAPGTAAAAGASTGRVRAMLTPKPDPTLPPAASAPALPAPVLRTSPALSPEKK